jgi:DnaK suppressor protein
MAPLTETELEDLRVLLERERDALRASDREQRDDVETVRLDQPSVGRLSRMDAIQGQAMALENQRRRRRRLLQVEAALARIGDDEYGECLDCGTAIDPRRLRIDPATTLCIDCAGKAERA